jgi:hypothetical protein
MDLTCRLSSNDNKKVVSRVYGSRKEKVRGGDEIYGKI